MQDMLVPIFGESGAIIAQYVITLAVVVGLIVLVVWGIRHFSGGAVRPATRGRLPRLAIVDSLPVDNKRKLVLLRRDNVEHLILIGGPSDVVVEPTIIRQRVAQRPGQGPAVRPSAAAVAPEMPPATAAEPFDAYLVEPVPAPVTAPAPPPSRASERETEAAETAIPFTPRRSTYGVAERSTAERVATERPERVTPPRRESLRGTMQAGPAPAAAEMPRPYRTYTPATSVPARTVAAVGEPDPEPAPAVAQRPIPIPARGEVAPSRFAPPPLAAEPEDPPDGPVPGYEGEDDDHEAVSAFAPAEAEPGGEADDDGGPGSAPEGVAAAPLGESEPAEGSPNREGVSELEQEMARLLNQISTSRRE